MIETPPTAVVTGASSGIGAATARRLAADGFRVVVGARRRDQLDRLAGDIGALAHPLDVTDRASVAEFVARLPDPVLVLVNNAGGARGLDPIERADEDEWRWMYDANVLGTLRVTQAVLPALRASGDGHVVVVSSVAGHEVYESGGGYTAAKHAQSALAPTLRLELLGEPIRVTEICPGLVQTEFSLVRFGGDVERAQAPYRGLRPLVADDVADCIAWAVTRPNHVNIDRIDVKPRAQATASRVHREETTSRPSR